MDKRKGTTKSTNESAKSKVIKQDYKITNTKKTNQPAKNPSASKKENKLMISKKFTFEIAAKIIQRNFRLYLKRIKSHPSYEMKQLLRKKKLGLLQSYNIKVNKEDSKKENPSYGEYDNRSKPKSKESLKQEVPVNMPSSQKMQRNEVNLNNNKEQTSSAVNAKQINRPMIYDIDENISQSVNNNYYNENGEEDEMNNNKKKEEEKNDDLVNVEKVIDNYVDLENDSINQLIVESHSKKGYNNPNVKNNKEAFVEEEDNRVENVYERIYKEMVKEKSSSKGVKDKNSNDSNSIPKERKKQLDVDVSIKQQERVLEDNDKMKPSSSNQTKEQVTNNMRISNKEKISPNKEGKGSNVATETEKINDSISLAEPQKDIIQSKKEIYSRLTQFLDNSDHSPKREQIEPIYPSKIPSAISKTNNLNAYLNDTQLQADNLGLNLELKEAKKTIDTMSSIITDLKDQLQQKDANMTKALLQQKQELDATLNRQNTLMESLYSEKKKNEIQITDLQEKLAQIEKNSYKKLQNIKENYELDTKKNKDAWFQAEKLRRKKWEDQKVKEIKELTAKGLEPEIEKIIANHKAEISTIEDNYFQNLKTQKEKIIDEYDLKYSELKHRLTKEKEESIEHEKNLAVQRLRNQSERLEEEINEERRRWNSKMQNEISRLESLREKDKKIYEDQISKLEDRNNNNVFSNEEFYKKKIDEMKKNYDDKISSEVALLKANMEKENERALFTQKNALEAKYKEMKLEFMKDRDKQINIVIEKLGEETMLERKKNQSDCEKKANEKNMALIEENSLIKKQLNDLTQKIQAETRNRVNLEDNIDQLTKRLNDKENDLARKEKQLNELTGNYSNTSDKLAGLTREFNKERMNLEIEMKSHMQKGEAELILLNNKLQNAQKLYENQKMEIENIHRKEVDEIEQKIAKSLRHRDEIIKKLQEEIQLKEITIQKYEEMLNQQRREYLSK